MTALFADHAGQLWVGVDSDLFLYKQAPIQPRNSERWKFDPIHRRDDRGYKPRYLG